VQTLKQILEAENRPRNLVVFLNPYSGHKEAKEIYEEKVKDMLEQANIKIYYYESESTKHITDIASKLDLQGVDGIVGVGGDGLINQIVNGLYRRSDLPIETIKSIPIGHIPAGSQNALAISINGKRTIQQYTYTVIRGVTRKLDLIDVYFPEYDRRVYSLITVAYGFLGDVLEESEDHRWMGPFRYQFCAVKQFFKNKAYRATISYLPHDTHAGNNNWITLDDVELDMACAFNISGETTQNPTMVPAQCDDGFITMLLVKKSSQIETLNYVYSVFNESHLSLDSVKVIKTKSVKFVPDMSNSSPINIDGELQPVSTMTLNAKERFALFYHLPNL
jgi:diacylglycerol kinase family enzyme